MKTLKTYLTESDRTYSFRIKMANMPEKEVIDKLETVLEKYELKSISKAKKTPIQEHPMDFQTLNNAEVYIMDVELSYPSTADQLYNYISEVVGVPQSHLVIINKDHPEEIAREEKAKESDEEYAPKLEDSDYKDGDKVKAEDHSGDKYNENMLKKIETRKYEFAKE